MIKIQAEDIDSKIEELQKELQDSRKNSKFFNFIKVDFWRFLVACIFSISLLLLSLLILIGVVYPKQYQPNTDSAIGLFWLFSPNNDPIIGSYMKTNTSLSLSAYGVCCIVLFLINVISALFYYGYSFKDENYLKLDKKSKVIFNYRTFGYSFFILVCGIILILGLLITDFTQFPDASKDIMIGDHFGYAFKISNIPSANVYELGIDVFGYLLIVGFFLINAINIFLFLKLNTKFDEMIKNKKQQKA
ncbi:hypothetical protein LNO75_02325 [Mycoplasma sp. T363T]|uniref:Uncharacterized protein n=1 Tax=Mycoplasma bradburyae TaxID=2963128 RepID=A0AAW6HPZ1_9MOLU|nr:hypothetical protein [Mycoplasma bradburyae]MDC4163412.1 hypothetical protein [Mycoplasma bradburyae]MDC4183399.1 hypothetical protein [Mycoplasma bradburyae]